MRHFERRLERHVLEIELEVVRHRPLRRTRQGRSRGIAAADRERIGQERGEARILARYAGAEARNLGDLPGGRQFATDHVGAARVRDIGIVRRRRAEQAGLDALPVDVEDGGFNIELPVERVEFHARFVVLHAVAVVLDRNRRQQAGVGVDAADAIAFRIGGVGQEVLGRTGGDGYLGGEAVFLVGHPARGVDRAVAARIAAQRACLVGDGGVVLVPEIAAAERDLDAWTDRVAHFAEQADVLVVGICRIAIEPVARRQHAARIAAKQRRVGVDVGRRAVLEDLVVAELLGRHVAGADQVAERPIALRGQADLGGLDVGVGIARRIGRARPRRHPGHVEIGVRELGEIVLFDDGADGGEFRAAQILIQPQRVHPEARLLRFGPRGIADVGMIKVEVGLVLEIGVLP